MGVITDKQYNYFKKQLELGKGTDKQKKYFKTQIDNYDLNYWVSLVKKEYKEFMEKEEYDNPFFER